jgi:hypothetical protein
MPFLSTQSPLIWSRNAKHFMKTESPLPLWSANELKVSEWASESSADFTNVLQQDYKCLKLTQAL